MRSEGYSSRSVCLFVSDYSRTTGEAENADSAGLTQFPIRPATFARSAGAAGPKMTDVRVRYIYIYRQTDRQTDRGRVELPRWGSLTLAPIIVVSTQQQRIATESAEEREARLQQVRSAQDRRIATESAEEREARLQQVKSAQDRGESLLNQQRSEKPVFSN